MDIRFTHLLKNSSWLALGGLGGSVLQFIQAILVARALGVENYGLLALIITYVSLLNQLVDFRIWETVIRYVSEFETKGERAKAQATIKLCYFLDATTGILAFFLVIVTSSFAASYLIHSPEVAALLNLYALSLLFSTTNGTSGAILRVFNKFSWLSLHGLSIAAIRLGVIVIALSLHPAIKGVIWAYLLTELIGGISINLLSLKSLRGQGFLDWREARISLLGGRLKEMRGFLLTTNFHAFLGLITKNLDTIFLGYFRNPTEVGFYKIAKNIAQLLGYLHDPIYSAIYPELAKLWSDGNRESFLRFIKQTTIFMASILSPAALFLMLFTPSIIYYIFGLAFLPATNAARILLIGFVIAGIFGWVMPAFLSMGRADIPMLANIWVAICQIVLSVLLIPKLGYIGSALILSFLYLFGHAILLPQFVWLLYQVPSVLKREMSQEVKKFYTTYHDRMGDKRFNSPYLIRRYVHRLNYYSIIRLLKEHIKAGYRVLDAGCGDGILLQLISESFNGVRMNILGTDISKPNIQAAKQHINSNGLGQNIPLIISDAEALPFADASFDIVISSHVLEHLPDFQKGLAEIRRITRSLAIIALPTCLNPCAMVLLGGDNYWKPGRKSPYAFFLGLVRLLLNFRNGGVQEGYASSKELPHLWRYPWVMKRELREAGFEIAKFEGASLAIPYLAYLLPAFLQLQKLIDRLRDKPFFRNLGYGSIAVVRKI